uniref:Ragulator complex protein LAMTOR5 n=1 Tax=Rhabditophanes sp. KR3021 TaxID=114890 RepID=A0AC35UFI0_9BILA
MGCCLSSPRDESLENTPFHGDKRPSRGVGMGIAMMMQQAGVILAANHSFDINNIQESVVRAKAQGKTVSLIDNNLYFDYQLVCSQIPLDCDLHV